MLLQVSSGILQIPHQWLHKQTDRQYKANKEGHTNGINPDDHPKCNDPTDRINFLNTRRQTF